MFVVDSKFVSHSKRKYNEVYCLTNHGVFWVFLIHPPNYIDDFYCI